MAKKSMHRDLKIGIGMMDGQKFLSHFNNVIHFLHDFPLKRLLQSSPSSTFPPGNSYLKEVYENLVCPRCTQRYFSPNRITAATTSILFIMTMILGLKIIEAKVIKECGKERNKDIFIMHSTFL